MEIERGEMAACQLKPENANSKPLEDISGRKTTSHAEVISCQEDFFCSVLSTHYLSFDTGIKQGEAIGVCHRRLPKRKK